MSNMHRQAQPCLLPFATGKRPKHGKKGGRPLPPIPSVRSLGSRRPILRALPRGPIRGRSGPVLLWGPTLLWRPVLRRRTSGRRPPTRRSGRNWPVVGRTRPYRLDRRPAVIRWAVIVRRTIIPGRTIIPRRTIPRTTNRMGEPRPRPRAVDGSGWTVIRRPIAPVASVPRAIAINHRARPVPRPWWPITTIPAAPRAAVVIDPPAAPVPSPTAPSPGLADQERGDANSNPERD
jgi:hypothetical protein